MVIAYIPLLFAIVGLLIYVLAKSPEVKHIGDVLMWTGWLVTMLAMASRTLRLG